MQAVAEGDTKQVKAHHGTPELTNPPVFSSLDEESSLHSLIDQETASLEQKLYQVWHVYIGSHRISIEFVSENISFEKWGH